MELLDITLTKLQRRNRAAFVSRAEIAGSPELVPGEKVVLRDEEGDYFAGTVIDELGNDGDVRYLVNVGVRLPEDYAMKRLGVANVTQDLDNEMQDLLDLLGEARALVNPRPLPQQRSGATAR